MANRGREVADLGRTLGNEPKAVPGKLLHIVRRSVRTIWDARGGGFYACGFVITFIVLEIRMLLEDVVSAEGVGDFFSEQLFEMFFRYFTESFVNSIKSFIWPLFVMQFRPPVGIIALIAGYFLFSRVLKSHLEDWLFEDAAAGQQDNESGGAV